jgi:methylated-DNA-[protein]-cysteine S-methyltransferase
MTANHSIDLTLNASTAHFGVWRAVFNDQGRLVQLGRVDQATSADVQTQNPLPPAVAAAVAELDRQLTAYLSGESRVFELTLAPTGTAFQHAVWGALLKIPYGQTTSYGAIAKALGNAKAAIAVGQAVGANPIAILIPCHRVLTHAGTLGGYAWGVETKAKLLELEKTAAAA